MDEKDLMEALDDAISIVEKAGIEYGLIGGTASEVYTYPRSLEDIDLLVKEEDAQSLLAKFKEAGFETEKQNARWLFKASRKRASVDIIFRLQGGMRFDNEAIEKRRDGDFRGRTVRLCSPEDLALSLVFAHDEPTSGYWFGARDILVSNEIDWDYFLRRARFGPRRVLSFTVYADSSDIVVPGWVIQRLYDICYGGNHHSSL